MPSATTLEPIDLSQYPLAVNEIFGPVWQGEGPSLGRLCSFIRLAGCNLHCSWCDTPYTWDWTGRNGTIYTVQEESHAMTVDMILRQLYIIIDQTGPIDPMFVISGGEPTLQWRGIEALITAMPIRARWEIETNGTMIPGFRSDLIDQYNVSPKLMSSGNKGPDAYKPDVLQWFLRTGRAIFKFVISEMDDLHEVRMMVQELRIPRDRVWIMPQGTTPEEIMSGGRALAPYVLNEGYNFTTRLHVLLYGNRRGV